MTEACPLSIGLIFPVGRDSSVGRATNYVLDYPRIESRWGRIFPHPSKPALGPTQLLYNGLRVFLGGKASSSCR